MKSATRTLPFTLLVLCTACANLGPPEPPSLQLPKPPSDLHASRKGDRVTLTWSIPALTTDRQNVRSLGPTQICRSLAPVVKDCGTPAGEAPPSPAVRFTPKKPVGKRASGPKNSTSYTDTLPPSIESDDPNSYVTYAIEVKNAAGRAAGLSNQVRVPLIRTLPPPSDFAARVTSTGVELSWTSSPTSRPNLVSYVYRVYRREEGATEQILVGEIPIADKPDFSLTDSNIEWEKTYNYHVYALTIIIEPNKPRTEIPGEDSPEVKVFVHDVFPPAVPSGLQAVYSGPGQQPFIDLVWAPDTDADLAGYNVYRHEEGGTPLKLNSTVVTTPAYRDSQVIPGKTYFYSISAVDVRGNESEKSEEASERVP